MKRLDGYDAAFNEQHFINLDLLEGDEEAPDDQQSELGDHEHMVSNFAFRFEQLSHPSAPSRHTEAPASSLPMDAKLTATMAAGPSQGLTRRLDHVKSSLRSVSVSVSPIVPGPDVDICLVHHLQKRLHTIGSSLTSVFEEILSLPR